MFQLKSCEKSRLPGIVRLKPCPAAGHLYTADSIFVLDFNTRGHFTGAKTLYLLLLLFFFYFFYFFNGLCFIMIISVYPESAFYPWSAVCSLHFTPGLQSAVCVLH